MITVEKMMCNGVFLTTRLRIWLNTVSNVWSVSSIETKIKEQIKAEELKKEKVEPIFFEK